MTAVLDSILSVDAVVVCLVVGLLVFAEDALFVGFLLPGETVAILGGVAASMGHVNVWLIGAVVVLAAIAGDTVGFEIGARFGPRLLNGRLMSRHVDRLDRARALLVQRGMVAVFLGRFVAFFRATMPGLAGLSGMPYARFAIANATGGFVWGIGVVLIGYLAGSSYEAVAGKVGRLTAIVVVAVAVAGLVGWHLRRRREPVA
ncbi:MAG: DedA family protein [Nocardioidaceae bacterium]